MPQIVINAQNIAQIAGYGACCDGPFLVPRQAALPSGVSHLAGDRGAALIGVLLLLMLMSGLAAALAVSGRTETLVVRNHQSSAQALAAAEGGLNHTVAVALSFLADWKANGYISVGAAVDALLADATLLEPGITLGSRIALPGTVAEYETLIMDEDDPARGADATDLTLDDDDTNDEDGTADNDSNHSLIVHSVGYTRDGASAVVEGIIAPLPLPAVLVNGDVEIDGNATITGRGGSAHSNADMEVDGNALVSGDATASGAYEQDGNATVGGLAKGGKPMIDTPTIRASDYRPNADFILTEGGRVTLPDATILCDASDDEDACEASYGWKFAGGNGWELENANRAGTFYVEGDVDVNGNVGSDASPLAVTIVSEGSIDINGNPVLTPETPELMLVADGDVRITGNFTMSPAAEGQILVREQARVEGNAAIAGQIIIEDADHDEAEEEGWHRDHDDITDDNRIRGNADITYNTKLATGTYVVTGWRHVR